MIKVGEDYQITADKYQFILSTRSKTDHEKAKSDYVWNKTFHASIEQAAKAIVDKETKKVVSKCSANDISLGMAMATKSIQVIVGNLTKAIERVQPHNEG